MINGVSNCSSAMSMMGTRTIQKPPPPQGRNVFQAADADGSGAVSQTELATLLKGINEVTGESVSVEDAINNYDTDQDGSLSGEELSGLMVDSGFPHPGPPDGEEGQDGMSSAIATSSEQAIASYAQNSGQDSIVQLLELLQGKDDDNSAISSSLNITY